MSAAKLEVGAKVYFDSFSGLVPGVISAVHAASDSKLVTVRLTTARGPYKQGEHVDTTARHAVPRSAVKGLRSKRGPRIIGGWAA